MTLTEIQILKLRKLYANLENASKLSHEDGIIEAIESLEDIFSKEFLRGNLKVKNINSNRVTSP